MTGGGYSPSSVMLVSNVISVLLGNGLCIIKERTQEGCLDTSYNRLKNLHRFWAGRQLVQMSLPAVLFTLSGTLKFIALGLVPPDVVTILEQSTVLLCAMMGWALLGKSYSALQVAMLIQVTCGVMWYQNAEQQSIASSPRGTAELLSHYRLGLALMFGSVVMVTAGGLSCEKLLKASTDRPFFVQKAQMEFSMAMASLFYCFVLQPRLQDSNPMLEHGLFHGWNGWTVLVLVLHTSKSWLATTTVRVLDNLTYTLAGNVAMLLVYAERLLLLDSSPREGFRPSVFASLCCTALGVGGFALATARRRRPPPSPLRRTPRRCHSKPPELLTPLLSRRPSKSLSMEAPV